MEPTERRLVEASEADRLRMQTELARVVALQEQVREHQTRVAHTAFVSLPWLFFCLLARFWWGLAFWLALALVYGALGLRQLHLAWLRRLLST